MTDLLARLRDRLAWATESKREAVAVDVADLEALLVIAEQPALSFVAEPGPRDIEVYFMELFLSRFAKRDTQEGGYFFVGPEGAAIAAEIVAHERDNPR